MQSRLFHSSCFVVLTASQVNLAVFSNKRFRTRTVVPNAGGIADFIAGSSIQTRIVSAAAIFARDVTNTGCDAVVLLEKKKLTIKICFLTNVYTKLLPSQITFRSMPFLQTSFLFFISHSGFVLLACILSFSRTKELKILKKWSVQHDALCRIVRRLGNSSVVFLLFEKLRY